MNNLAHKITCDLDEDCSCDVVSSESDDSMTDGAPTVGGHAARLKLVVGEEFASLVHRITMRTGLEPRGILLVAHWGERADVNVLLPTVNDPDEAAEILQEMKASADLSVDDLFRTKGDA